MEPLQCSRCDRIATGPEEIAGSWFTVGGAVVCPTCQRLEDMVAVQNEREVQDGPTMCPGCGRDRRRDEFWRGYLLDAAQLERTLIRPEDPGRVTVICPECEHRVLFGIEL